MVGSFFTRGTDLIVLGIVIAITGDAASHYIQKHTPKIWENIIGLIFLFWMRLIVLESAKILLNPEISITPFSPLIFYTIAGLSTTIIMVILVYRQYGREAFGNPLR